MAKRFSKITDTTFRGHIQSIGIDVEKPRVSEAGQCSRIPSDRRLIVRPTYDVRNEHSKWYTQKLAVVCASCPSDAT